MALGFAVLLVLEKLFEAMPSVVKRMERCLKDQLLQSGANTFIALEDPAKCFPSQGTLNRDGIERNCICNRMEFTMYNENAFLRIGACLYIGGVFIGNIPAPRWTVIGSVKLSYLRSHARLELGSVVQINAHFGLLISMSYLKLWVIIQLYGLPNYCWMI